MRIGSSRWSRSFAIFPLGIVGLLVAKGAIAQGSPEELFQKGKAEFRTAAYAASLETFQKLDEASRAPGFEAARAKLEPVLAFYRGANLAALGRKEDARREFETYLAAVPNARLDPGAFPKSVLEVFNDVRKKAVAAASESIDAGMEEEYSSFSPQGRQSLTAFPDEQWADGAIRYLMTKEEKLAWQRLQTTVDRVEFVVHFWQRRDPALRDEIERRVEFADARFKLTEKRGSETDRGLVFVLMGPPSYVGLHPLKPEDDPIQILRNKPTQEIVSSGQGTVSYKTVRPMPLSAQRLQGTRETWYYRRDRLPKYVQFTEVNFEFQTKEGVGEGVLQRKPDVLMTLDAVSASMLPRD